MLHPIVRVNARNFVSLSIFIKHKYPQSIHDSRPPIKNRSRRNFSHHMEAADNDILFTRTTNVVRASILRQVELKEIFQGNIK